MTNFDKIITADIDGVKIGRIIGEKVESDGSTTYKVEPLCIDYSPRKNGRIYFVNSKTLVKLKDGLFAEIK